MSIIPPTSTHTLTYEFTYAHSRMHTYACKDAPCSLSGVFWAVCRPSVQCSSSTCDSVVFSCRQQRRPLLRRRWRSRHLCLCLTHHLHHRRPSPWTSPSSSSPSHLDSSVNSARQRLRHVAIETKQRYVNTETHSAFVWLVFIPAVTRNCSRS